MIRKLRCNLGVGPRADAVGFIVNHTLPGTLRSEHGPHGRRIELLQVHRQRNCSHCCIGGFRRNDRIVEVRQSHVICVRRWSAAVVTSSALLALTGPSEILRGNCFFLAVFACRTLSPASRAETTIALACGVGVIPTPVSPWDCCMGNFGVCTVAVYCLWVISRQLTLHWGCKERDCGRP